MLKTDFKMIYNKKNHIFWQYQKYIFFFNHEIVEDFNIPEH